MAAGVPEIVHDVLHSPSQPLDATTRAFMEPRFGRDFSQVRIHADANAADSARAVNALAYTVGRDIVFAAGHYAPGTSEGRKLLGHELTHVMHQQRTSTVAGATQTLMGPQAVPSASHEREASLAANESLHSTPARIKGRTAGPAVQRGAPLAAAAAVISRYAIRCILSALVGVLLDLGIQAGMHSIRQRTTRFWEVTIDYCSVVLSAVLGCLGGMVALRWLEPFLNARLGARTGAVAGTLLGKLLVWIATRAGVGIPQWVVKQLFRWGCVSMLQAEAISPGSTREEEAPAETREGGAPEGATAPR